MKQPPATGRRLAVVITAVLLLVSLVRPPHPELQLLQHLPTALALGALWIEAGRERWSYGALACCLAFLLLHIVGARWIYSLVPGGERLTWLALGDGGVGRNHYDRLVHLLFGVLMVLPCAELLRRLTDLSWRAAVWGGVLLIVAIGSLYEVFEWLLTLTVAPEMAMEYNGQQGDPWDAQKDMALAMVGAVAGGLFWSANR